ncbi:MAG: hypothetical protein OXB94_08055 [Nitrospira sp.]|nr:hypothetical protein [Nitrospira sp.]
MPHVKKKTIGGPLRFLLCLVGVAVGAWLVPVSVLSLTNDLTNDPAKVVKKYLSLDKRGVRLTAHSYEAVMPYVAWEREEPVWERFVVIRDYAVSDDVTQWDIVSSTEARIPVTFQVLGVVHVGTATFVPAPEEEVLSIRIRAVDNHWKMVSPVFPPHVGRSRLADFVKDAMLREPNDDRARTLRRLREDLVNAGRS